VCSICLGPLVICALVDVPSLYGEYTLYDEDMSVYSEFTRVNYTQTYPHRMTYMTSYHSQTQPS
jgi:hypothetical protein